MRIDIQLLRALAISVVVGYHAGLPLPSGFLGVDVFFVVSGFLITSMVERELTAGTFRFRDFYTKRAKRLLPAAYVTFLLTTLAAMALLTSREFLDFGKTLRGAITFTGNLELLAQTGYFDGDAEAKPLLHTWSLAIEEQYYVGLPLLLWLLPARMRRLGIAALTLASLAWCYADRLDTPNEVFYRLEYRAWELGLGSLTALWTLPRRLSRALFWPALVVLLVLPWVPRYWPHPGEQALLIGLATAIVVARAHAGFTRVAGKRWAKPLVRIGDVSYSWYLVHWPILALLYAVHLQAPPQAVKVLAIMGSLAVAFLMYRFVEQPTRHGHWRFTPLRLAGTLAISALFIAWPLAWRRTAKLDARVALRADNIGFAEACDFRRGYRARPECQNGPAPTLLVWGDSMGMHLVHALAEVWPTPIRQATQTSCGPALGHAPVNHTRLTRKWALGCLKFNDDVLAELARSPTISTVVLASSFERFANPGYGEVLLRGQAALVPASVELATRAFEATIDALTQMGKRVVVVAPPPATTFDVGACLERLIHHQLTLGRHASCQILDADRRHKQRYVLALMAQLAARPNVHVVDLATQLCDGDRCQTMRDGQPLYVDDMHLTVNGSLMLAKTHNWATWGVPPAPHATPNLP